MPEDTNLSPATKSVLTAMEDAVMIGRASFGRPWIFKKVLRSYFPRYQPSLHFSCIEKEIY